MSSKEWADSRNSPKNAGFTLVELLTVIVLVSLLAALFSPAFRTARNKGRQIGCMNNLKQMGLATILYCQESGGDVFPAYGGGVEYSWFFNNGFLKNLGIKDSTDLSSRKTRHILVCPSQNPPNYSIIYYYSYGMGAYRYWSDSSSAWVGYCPKLLEHSNPGKYILYVDAITYYLSGSSYASIDARHDNGVNACYVDGHVGYIPKPPEGYNATNLPFGGP
ncbi:MAG: prepilin-type N-terminal cleavage/methylation domain-containing protein [Verrucomicrobiae bacterium]|nr:prepilin-type N-terminal cleavage/methylation domain-containing protein [Verrucomicrobiae bacterium]